MISLHFHLFLYPCFSIDIIRPKSQGCIPVQKFALGHLIFVKQIFVCPNRSNIRTPLSKLPYTPHSATFVTCG
jgi:hypothetical protein